MMNPKQDEKMVHEQAMELVSSRMSGGSPPPEALGEALDHVAGCAECLRELAVTAKLLGAEEAFRELIGFDRLCDMLQERMAELAELGDEEVRRYPLEMEHIRTCRLCQKRYEDTVDLIQRDTAGEFGEAPAVTGEAMEKTGLWIVADGLGRLSKRIEVLLTPAGLQLSQLADGISAYRTPPPIPQGAMVGLRTSGEIDSKHGEAIATQGWIIRIPDVKPNRTLRIELRQLASSGIEGRIGVETGAQTSVLYADEIAARNDVGRWVTLAKKSASFRVRPSMRVESLKISQGGTVLEIPLRIRDERGNERIRGAAE